MDDLPRVSRIRRYGIRKLIVVNEHQFDFLTKLGITYGKNYVAAAIPNSKGLQRKLRKQKLFDYLKSASINVSKDRQVVNIQRYPLFRNSRRLKNFNLNLEKSVNLNGIQLASFLSEIFKNNSFLQKVSINLAWCNWIKDFIFSKPKQSLFLKNLKHLSFNISGYVSDKANQCVAFLDYLLQKKVRKLQSIDFVFIQCRKLNELSFERICAILKAASNLKSFSLNIRECFMIYKNVHESIEEALKDRSKIINLKIQNGNSQWRNQISMDSLSRTFSKMPFLRKCLLYFYEARIMSNSQESFSFLTHLLSLNELNLYFLGQVHIQKIDLDHLGFALSKLQKLTRIDLQFFKCNKEFDDSCVKTLFKGISEITGLKNLTIHLEELNLTRNGFFQIGQFLQNLHQLAYLEICVLRCSQVNEKAISLFGRFLTHLGSVLHLKFKLAVKSLDDQNFGSFLENFSTFHNLKSLNLQISQPHEIGDKGVKSLAEIIKSFYFLTEFTLSLKQSKNLTDEGLVAIGRLFPTKVFLETLSLDFEMSMNITDLGFESLMTSIAKSNKIISLSLGFSYCANISERSFLKSQFYLRKLKRLRQLTIRFPRKSTLSDESATTLTFYKVLSEKRFLQQDLIFE